MINKNFWDLLAEKQDSLTKSGTIIADYLTKHAEEAQFLSISSLAKACNMAEATIYRFCKQLGFEGYNEMKISLAQANVTPTPFSSYSLDPSMPTSSLCDNVCASFQAAISNTMSVLDFDAIDEAALLLQRATSVYCLGQGGSRVLANDIWVRFATISNKFRNCGDSHTQLIAASLMGPGDVILFVSYSGSTHDMMDTLSVAKKTGAKIILITHYPDAPAQHLQMLSSCAVPWKHHWMAAVSRSRSVSYSLPNRLSCVICSTTASLPKSPAIKPVLPWWQSFCKTQIKEKSCSQNMISFVVLSNRNIIFRLYDFSFLLHTKLDL